MDTDNDLENILNAQSLDNPDYWNEDNWKELASLPEPLSNPRYWDDDNWKELASVPEPLSDPEYWDDNNWKEVAGLNMPTNPSEGKIKVCTEINDKI